jgi:exodeoxyribonuclease VII large subunit
MNDNKQRQIWQVSDVNKAVKEVLENSFMPIWVAGEIGSLNLRGNHVYFSLKDSSSQISCCWFNGAGQCQMLRLTNGTKVYLEAKIRVYEVRGEYQLTVLNLQPVGIGQLQLQFEDIKKRLYAEGLFDQARKKVLPLLPSKIGVVTSPAGAALRDFLNIITRRFPKITIRIYPAAVQGVDAARQVANGVNYFNRTKEVDVIVVTRGGGSMEDLWPFNDEALARTVAASSIPVISAVGHEIDYTICDFVSDLRVPTPSAAAELVVGGQEELINRVTIAQRHMNQTLQLRLSNAKNHLANLLRSSLFHEPKRLIEVRSMQIDELEMRMENILNNRLTVAKNKLANLENNLRHLNPKNILERGYTMVFDHDGKPVTSAQLNEGSLLELHFADGIVDVKVEHAEKFEA